jgi:magnesium transporter
VIVECAVYEDGERRAGELELSDACEAAQEPGAFVWIDLFEPTQGEFRALREEFGLHPLAVEDALLAHERPKLERYDDVAFLALKTVVYDDAEEEVRIGEVLLFAGEAFVITVRHGEGTVLDAVRERVEGDPDVLRRGAAGTLHAVLDHVVDAYEPVVRGLQADIDEVENALFSSGGGDSTRRIYKLGREVLEFSRAVQPLVEPVMRLANREGAAGAGDIDEDLQRYFKDVEDHVVRIDQWVASQRDLLSNLLQANLTQVTIGQNADMRRISAWVAIVAVPTAVAGIYGMNFEHMPELRWTLGYPSVLLFIAAVCSVLYWRFKKAGWL